MDTALITIELILILLLAWISVEDYIFRAVSWFLYPMLAFASTGYSLRHVNWEQWLSDTSFNFLFVAAQLALLTAYFSIRAARLVNISRDLIGWGDILFFLATGLLFAPANYCAFYIGSLTLAVLAAVLRELVSENTDRCIPLAGIQATALAILLICSIAHSAVDLTDDSWFARYLITLSE
nr:hypothetical protein [uncultured Dyadobacter sp.]